MRAAILLSACLLAACAKPIEHENSLAARHINTALKLCASEGGLTYVNVKYRKEINKFEVEATCANHGRFQDEDDTQATEDIVNIPCTQVKP